MTYLDRYQPLLPEDRAISPLLDLAGELVTEALRLTGQAGPGLIAALRPRLRAMNSYYSNRIEGQHTRPAQIESALRKDFDADLTLARKQRLALAHMAVEEEMEGEATTPRDLFSTKTILAIHRRLYERLLPDDRRTDDGELTEPGELRRREVSVGTHVAPEPAHLADLLEVWAQRYGNAAGREMLLIAMACSHHRLVWIHPFVDGNGRVARLHSHLFLHSLGLTRGLWSPMRGLARSVEQYYARLHNADLPRRNDLDGRGALSQEELVRFADYFLRCCLDQVRFMDDRLQIVALRENLGRLLGHLAANPWPIGSEKSVVKMEALEALHYAILAGSLDRARFIGMTGLGERTGRRVMTSLLDYGLLVSDSPRGRVGFALPMKAMGFVFPGLWPEADTD